MLLALIVPATYVGAQELEISVSPSPVGSGARAAGMGDAFVAIADDATAASWNPAGLIQLERPEISIVGAYTGVIERFSADEHSEVDSWNRADTPQLNFLSLTYPIPYLFFDRNLVVGIYYQYKYDFARDFSIEYDAAWGSEGGLLNTFSKLDFEQEGALHAITPAFAFEITKHLALGVGLNLWRSTPLGRNEWEQRMDRRTLALMPVACELTRTKTREKYSDVRGESYTAGLLWNLSDRWSLGARYDSAWTAKADFKREEFTVRSYFAPWGGSYLGIEPGLRNESREIRFPATLAVGAAVRVDDRLTLSADISRTDWNDFWYRSRWGGRTSLVNTWSFDDFLFPAHFDPTYTVRFGGEYVAIPKQPDVTLKRLWSFRGGLFYDQEPASGTPDNFYGLAAGIGLLLNQRVNIDLAYQLRCGFDVNGDFVRGISGFDEDVFQNRFLLSTVIYF
ncbi:MAG TPA: outer membrane protein transport protein [Candidatus Hydrogenedentes bacterium]|nr:outer membrane protein transport protein [Candidatus Hydrogenedentota bacterium]HPG68734.1 outer membrane protein transport protein [Candidatus Hydrogenedentota bacterium]